MMRKIPIDYITQKIGNAFPFCVYSTGITVLRLHPRVTEHVHW